MTQPDIREVEPGVYSILQDGKSFVVRIAGPVAGRRSNSGPGAGNPTASMPGKVIRVLVTVGQQVHAAQGLIVIEAMKMQNEIKAAKAGRITKINVQDGVTVAAGDILLVLE